MRSAGSRACGLKRVAEQPGKGEVRLKAQAVGLNRAEAAGVLEAVGPTWTRAGSASGCRRFPRLDE
jgi:hypothetical protein